MLFIIQLESNFGVFIFSLDSIVIGDTLTKSKKLELWDLLPFANGTCTAEHAHRHSGRLYSDSVVDILSTSRSQGSSGASDTVCSHLVVRVKVAVVQHC